MALKNLDPPPRSAQALRVPILLIDNSNTRTKFALAESGESGGLLDWQAIIPTAEVSEKTLTDTLAEVAWDGAVISSVVPEKSAVLQAFCEGKPCHVLNHTSKLPFGIDYPKPAQIGADRLANSAAAVLSYKHCPLVVLDFGTALTFDVITENESSIPQYRGGVIAPGLASMTEGLARRTALLPHITLSEPQQVVGRSTEDAMLAGAFHGYRGLIQGILDELDQELSGDPLVIATGGDAQLITAGMKDIHHLSPLLTLEGLRIIAYLNL
ncbi:MAG: type III pantothenate kinase [Akkermansiaceae bacterium]